MNLFIALGGMATRTLQTIYDICRPSTDEYYVIDMYNDLSSMDETNLHFIDIGPDISLKRILYKRPEVKEWFPVKESMYMESNDVYSFNEGRAIARLLFEEACSTKLKELIKELKHANADEVNIHIISGIMGASSSGILLPITLWLRSKLNDDTKYKIYTYLIPPEFALRLVFAESDKNGIKINSAATLLELIGFIEKYSLNTNEELVIKPYDDSKISKLFDGMTLLQYKGYEESLEENDDENIHPELYLSKEILNHLSKVKTSQRQVEILKEAVMAYVEVYNEKIRTWEEVYNHPEIISIEFTPHIDITWHKFLKKYCSI